MRRAACTCFFPSHPLTLPPSHFLTFPTSVFPPPSAFPLPFPPSQLPLSAFPTSAFRLPISKSLPTSVFFPFAVSRESNACSKFSHLPIFSTSHLLSFSHLLSWPCAHPFIPSSVAFLQAVRPLLKRSAPQAQRSSHLLTFFFSTFRIPTSNTSDFRIPTSHFNNSPFPIPNSDFNPLRPLTSVL
jgi:hypothetical protein